MTNYIMPDGNYAKSTDEPDSLEPTAPMSIDEILERFELRCKKETFTNNATYQAKAAIKAYIAELLGEMESRETEDMRLKSWTPEDYKAFGRNELRAELRQKAGL